MRRARPLSIPLKTTSVDFKCAAEFVTGPAFALSTKVFDWEAQAAELLLDHLERDYQHLIENKELPKLSRKPLLAQTLRMEVASRVGPGAAGTRRTRLGRSSYYRLLPQLADMAEEYQLLLGVLALVRQDFKIRGKTAYSTVLWGYDMSSVAGKHAQGAGIRNGQQHEYGIAVKGIDTMVPLTSNVPPKSDFTSVALADQLVDDIKKLADTKDKLAAFALEHRHPDLLASAGISAAALLAATDRNAPNADKSHEGLMLAQVISSCLPPALLVRRLATDLAAELTVGRIGADPKTLFNVSQHGLKGIIVEVESAINRLDMTEVPFEFLEWALLSGSRSIGFPSRPDPRSLTYRFSPETRELRREKHPEADDDADPLDENQPPRAAKYEYGGLNMTAEVWGFDFKLDRKADFPSALCLLESMTERYADRCAKRLAIDVAPGFVRPTDEDCRKMIRHGRHGLNIFTVTLGRRRQDGELNT